VQEYDRSQQTFVDRIRTARSEDDRSAAYADRPGPRFLPRFVALAEEVAGSEASVQARVWVFRLAQEEGDIDLARTTLARLLTEAIGSLALADLPDDLRHVYRLGQETCLRALETIMDSSPHARVRAAAMVNLGILLKAAEPGRAKALFERAIEEFGDGVGPHVERARGNLFELERLQPGMLAPDIEGRDLDGVPFKLSDYRGRVVLLDFWGHW